MNMEKFLKQKGVIYCGFIELFKEYESIKYNTHVTREDLNTFQVLDRSIINTNI